MFSSQTPLPQLCSHWPQSPLQVLQLSPLVSSQTPSPQVPPQGPQSLWQVLHDSPAVRSHRPSPHPLQLPQSAVQLAQSSPPSGSHWPLPHSWQVPQSSPQLVQVSPAAKAQIPSPQVTAQPPQSLGHDKQLSPAPHTPSPQPTLPQLPPQVPHRAAHVLSHALVQQLGSMPQTHSVQLQPSQPGVGLGWQPAVSPHLPQSSGQVEQASPAPHTPSPHTPGQPPQSVGQVPQFSFALALHRPSPQPGARHSPSTHTRPAPHSVASTCPVSVQRAAYGPRQNALPGSQSLGWHQPTGPQICSAGQSTSSLHGREPTASPPTSCTASASGVCTPPSPPWVSKSGLV